MQQPDQPQPGLAPKLARALAALAQGVSLISESERPYRAFSASLPRTTGLTEESFRAAVQIGPRYRIDGRAADAFFRQNQDPTQFDASWVQTHALLEKVMKATLSDRRVVYVRGTNVVRVRFYLFGRLDDGNLAGLRSTAIET